MCPGVTRKPHTHVWFKPGYIFSFALATRASQTSDPTARSALGQWTELSAKRDSHKMRVQRRGRAVRVRGCQTPACNCSGTCLTPLQAVTGLLQITSNLRHRDTACYTITRQSTAAQAGVVHRQLAGRRHGPWRRQAWRRQAC